MSFRDQLNRYGPLANPQPVQASGDGRFDLPHITDGKVLENERGTVFHLQKEYPMHYHQGNEPMDLVFQVQPKVFPSDVGSTQPMTA